MHIYFTFFMRYNINHVHSYFDENEKKKQEICHIFEDQKNSGNMLVIICH